jgi:pyrroline-5-carboxylate reductase
MKIADTFGSAFELSEAMMPAFIGISGSGIAYVFQFLHAMALGGTREGIPYQKSIQIACDTLLSAVMLQKQSGQNPIDLLSSVCSAGGTTIEGIEALEKNAFDHAVIEAVTVAAEKSKRL